MTALDVLYNPKLVPKLQQELKEDLARDAKAWARGPWTLGLVQRIRRLSYIIFIIYIIDPMLASEIRNVTLVVITVATSLEPYLQVQGSLELHWNAVSHWRLIHRRIPDVSSTCLNISLWRHQMETFSGGRHRYRYQAITWINVNLSSVGFCDTHQRPISQEVSRIFCKMT